MLGLRIGRIGYGKGTRKFGSFTSLLRVFRGEIAGPRGTERVIEISAAVDDATPEQLGALFEFLPDAGALDVLVTPVVMKKNRPGHEIRALATEENLDAVVDALFRHSSTFGVRVQPVARRVLDKRSVEVITQHGKVCIKEGLCEGRVVSASPEFDDCLRLARARGVSVDDVMRAALVAYATKEV